MSRGCRRALVSQARTNSSRRSDPQQETIRAHFRAPESDTPLAAVLVSAPDLGALFRSDDPFGLFVLVRAGPWTARLVALAEYLRTIQR